jgi:hypothetical protein
MCLAVLVSHATTGKTLRAWQLKNILLAASVTEIKAVAIDGRRILNLSKGNCVVAFQTNEEF